MIREQFGTKEAENLLEDIGVNQLPINPDEIVENISTSEFKVEIHQIPFQSPNILGKADGAPGAAVICINSNIPDPRRLNFTAAHEIGHVCLHIMSSKQISFACGVNEITNPYEDPYEQEANGFASGLLMPGGLIKKISNLDINWVEIAKISQKCNTSLEATFRRLVTLNKSPSALIMHQNLQFKRFVASDNFEFYINRQPLSHEQKELCTDGVWGDFSDNFEEGDASEWVNPVRNGQALRTIYSSSVSLENGFVYTIISYDNDCLSELEETI